ncbi:hypothetical protein AGMMS49982_14740 [Bacteroidia bacterium]|nr:hypothetical protein AGMMS49982_14740 [Bacteroidia bacterium]
MVKEYVERFNQKDEELYVQFVPNSEAADFLTKNIPRFECPDKELEEIYYFRWWTYRKHIQKTPEGFVITEFLPKVGWAGKYNAINCAAALHYGEGRWLHNSEYLKAYSYYWLRGGGSVRTYVFPVAYALYNNYLVTGNDAVIKDLFPELIKTFEAWEGDHFDAKHGLFWQIDGYEGTELSIGGHGLRPVINASMIADAQAIAKIAALLGNKEQQTRFEQKAAELQKKMLETLWDKDAQFFKVLQLWEKQNMSERGAPKEIPTLADVRELCGYAPWMFGLAKPEHAVAWKFLMDKKHFYAPFGPTFAEQSHPQFTISYKGHECQWNGPTWPMSTSMTLLGLANLLQTEQQKVITKKDYLDLLKVYAHSHHLKKDDGTVVPWIDENLNPFTGDWISRTRLKTWKNGTWSQEAGGVERGKDYNHSEFCDLIISGLVGLRPAEGDILTVYPLATDEWEWFALENVLYHGKTISVIWDKTGKKYGKGQGFMVFVNGKKIATSKRLGELKVDITAKQWKKYVNNPVLGGAELGTCFDLTMLQEDGKYKMWFSWRPKDALAYTESTDGIKWSEPVIVLAPVKEHEWEQGINRPTILKKDGIYHLWYTGQDRPHNKRSHIGYATSTDGIHFERKSDKPVLVAEKGWEKELTVMIPNVEWDAKGKIFKMWYSGGETNEPNAIGYATSPDGLVWTKYKNNPIFSCDKNAKWEQHKVAGAHIFKHGDWYLMFYIGYENEDLARIGLARSKDGITNWERLPTNPIISPDKGAWDASACYKPFVIYNKAEKKWRLWYNGRNGNLERIGLVFLDGDDLGFPEKK